MGFVRRDGVRKSGGKGEQILFFSSIDDRILTIDMPAVEVK